MLLMRHKIHYLGVILWSEYNFCILRRMRRDSKHHVHPFHTKKASKWLRCQQITSHLTDVDFLLCFFLLSYWLFLNACDHWRLLNDRDNADTELLIYATTLINKTLSGLSDQDSFYDESDLLEQQGMENIIQYFISQSGVDLELLDQLQLYDAVLKWVIDLHIENVSLNQQTLAVFPNLICHIRFEDGEANGLAMPDNSFRKTRRCRSINVNGPEVERRKSRRHSCCEQYFYAFISVDLLW